MYQIHVQMYSPAMLAIDWSQPPAGIGGGTGGIEIDLG
jgi:hypothetical protein